MKGGSTIGARSPASPGGSMISGGGGGAISGGEGECAGLGGIGTTSGGGCGISISPALTRRASFGK